MKKVRTTMDNRLKILTIYFITLIVAACSIVYELMCAQALSLLAANMVKWYSITIGVFLASMGIGALNVHRLSNRWGTWNALFYVEIALCLLGALAVMLIRIAHIGYSYLHVHNQIGSAQILFFGSVILVIFLVGLLTGYELPLLIEAGNSVSGKEKVTNRVLGVDYIGCLLGSLAFPLFLLPTFDLITTGFIMAGMNVAVAGLIITQSPHTAPPLLKIVLTGLFAIAVGAGIWNKEAFNQYFLKKYYYFRSASESLSTLFAPANNRPHVMRERSPYQNIDFVKASHLSPADTLIFEYSTKFVENPDYPIDTVLFLNGDFQFFSLTDEIYHEFFAHVPIIKSKTVPEEILVLGAGDGLLIKELLKYPQVRSITHVDLDPVLVKLASTQPALRAMNNGSLLDPRVQTIIDDGYQYVRTLKRKYSAIYIDFPDPVDYNLARLYSAEFYYFIKNHLTEGGFVVFDAVGIERRMPPDAAGRRELMPLNPWLVFYHTLRKAGFKTILPILTTLGTHNQQAWDRLNQDNPPVPEDEWNDSEESRQFASRVDYLVHRERAMAAFLENYARLLKQGFIMAVNGPIDSQNEFHDFGIKMHLLNAERYQLAFDQQYDKPARIDMSKVNSIMRPTLPKLPITFVRLGK